MKYKEKLFLFLSAIFLTALVLGNIIGTTKFVRFYFFTVPAGVLAYPFTFLATDLICELYGKKRAQFLVIVGFTMNFFMLGLMTLGHFLSDANGVSGGTSVFESVYKFMIGNVIASMIAYLIAQTVDVNLFHFWKNLTKGKHLWLRNNLSTLISQAVDSIMVISITFGAAFLAGNIAFKALLVLIGSNYLFKMTVALVDTGPFYLLVHHLKNYLQIDNTQVD